MIEKITEYIKHPTKIFIFLQNRCNFPVLPDRSYLRIKYNLAMGKKLDLKNPQTFNEKLQWLKLYSRKPEYTCMVDKYEAKQYVAQKIGEEYIIPTLGVWDNFDDIDFDSLPNQFVLKCTHDSSGLIIVRDKAELDQVAAKKKIEKSLKKNYYYLSREWPYKNVKPRIIAEKYMQDGKTVNLPVYKILNFAGEPQIIQAIQNDKTEFETIDYFDTNWNRFDLKQNFPNSDYPIKRPECFEDMLELAKKLSQNIPHIRTDFYVINGKLYFSEFTFYSDAGFAPFSPECWDRKLGEWIILEP